MSFADSFWTNDYKLGVHVLFEKLHLGIQENEDFVQLFNKRVDLEYLYGMQLVSIDEQMVQSNKKLQNNDEYISTVKNGFKQLNENYATQGSLHIQIANDLKEYIVEPFGTWCEEHKKRIKFSESEIISRHSKFLSGKQNLEKLRKRYFNKCRLLEEFKAHFSEEELDPKDKEPELEYSNETFLINNTSYDYTQVKQLLTKILTSIELTSHKVPILGTYANCSSGSAITQWLLDNVPEINNHLNVAEDFCQSFIDNGFIKMIGSMNSKSFINSSKYFYQWKPIVFEITRLNYEFNFQLADYFEDVKQVMGVNSVNFNDKSQLGKLTQEITQLDSQYFLKTVEVDKLRCELEENIFDHLTFMEKCELDRLRAIKKVMYDYVTFYFKNFNEVTKTLTNLSVLEETINPVNDLKFLIENFQMGSFNPQVILYDNYYKSNICQNFGVDLGAKSRLDKKVVPSLVQCILLKLDEAYPLLNDDRERVDLWIKPISLTKIHEIRFKVNSIERLKELQAALKDVEPILLSNLLKLYLMELPDSLISSNLFDLIKSLYQMNSEESKTRITGLKNVLANLPKPNLATLDAILTHLLRFKKIVGQKNKEIATELNNNLTSEFGGLFLKPKTEDREGDTYNPQLVKKLQHRLVSDLFDNKDIIFDDLRRKNSKDRKNTDSNDEGTERKVVEKEEPSAEPREPTTPSRTSLKRSTSPNKKKLNTYLSEQKSANSSTTSLKSEDEKPRSKSKKKEKKAEKENIIVVD